MIVPSQTHADVLHTTALTPHVLQIILSPDDYIPFYAGQYLQIISTPQPQAYSIANAPNASKTYELHIRHEPDTPKNEALTHLLMNTKKIAIELPFGSCHLNTLDPEKPIIFIAGGTGFAPIKAMIEQLFRENQTRPVYLYWRVRHQHDLYMHALAQHWEKEAPWFHYIPQPPTLNQLSISEHIIAQHNTHLADWQIVLAGPFDMVYAIRDELVGHGVSPTHLHSDAFAFEN